jgi:hypothetical protein
MTMTEENPSTLNNIRSSVTWSTTNLTRIGPGSSPESRGKMSAITTRAAQRFKHQPSSKRYRTKQFPTLQRTNCASTTTNDQLMVFRELVSTVRIVRDEQLHFVGKTLIFQT